jgi:DNA-binding NarL/FixJ family response regulator
VTDILESVGAVVNTVGSAEAALITLQAEPPDVLVSDLLMPGKGGYWKDAVPTRPAVNGTASLVSQTLQCPPSP